MLYSDIKFYDNNYNLITGDIEVEDSIVTSVIKKDKCIDSSNAVIPPLTDLHIHGGYGVDIMKSKADEIIYLSKMLYSANVGAYIPTTVAKSYDDILASAKEIKLASQNKDYAEILGIHIEGPFISPKYRGIMEEKYITPCNIKLYEDLKNIMGDLKIRFTVAPECDGAEEFCRYVVKNNDYISIGHSGGSAEDCAKLVNSGASSYTHLFNAMSPVNHRNMGVAGAGLTDESFVEVICDFVHLSEDCIKLIVKAKKDKIIIVTDAMEAMGLGKGEFIFCGKKVYSDGISVKDKTGRLAGSVLTMKKALSNMIKITDIKSALIMAAKNPARLLGLEKYGCIDTGKRIIL